MARNRRDEHNMAMNKKMLMALLASSLPALALAAPDFNGTWVRDKAMSDAQPNTMYWLTRGVDPGGGGQGNADILLVVKQDAKNLNVAESTRVVREYVLDGKPHTRATDTGVEKAIVTTSWQGETLVIATSQPYGGMPGNATLKQQEVWSLSADGKMLTIATTRDVPAARQAYKQVYNRK
jgi:hypothetical protein